MLRGEVWWVDFDPVRFATFRIEYGELVWGDYDLCFPVIDLYLNQLEHGFGQEVVGRVSVA